MVVALLCVWGYCLVDFTRTDESAMRAFSKPVWTVFLVFTSVIGLLVWLVYRRPRDRRTGADRP